MVGVLHFPQSEFTTTQLGVSHFPQSEFTTSQVGVSSPQ